MPHQCARRSALPTSNGHWTPGDDELVIALDYAAVLRSTTGADPDDGRRRWSSLNPARLAPPTAPARKVEDEMFLLAASRHNFSMPLRVEVWSAAPGDDVAAWPEALRACVWTSARPLSYVCSPTVDAERVPRTPRQLSRA